VLPTGPGTIGVASAVGLRILEDIVPVRLVLWDIDHTLLELHSLHYDLYSAALPLAFGRTAERLPDMTGRTDRDSSTEFLTTHGIEPTDMNLETFWAVLVEQFDKVQSELPSIGRTTHGAEAALAALCKVPDLYQSVLTGNLRALAERKLGAFGLDQYLDFDLGGYGEDRLDRAALVPVARKRFEEKLGVMPELVHTLLIGDTPLDIDAARASGGRVIAVATGKSTYRELVRLHPDVVLHDLSDTSAVVRGVEASSLA
jgi:phosphoglycolate phosphatase